MHWLHLKGTKMIERTIDEAVERGSKMLYVNFMKWQCPPINIFVISMSCV